jgi:hypothetical protein
MPFSNGARLFLFLSKELGRVANKGRSFPSHCIEMMVTHTRVISSFGAELSEAKKRTGKTSRTA